MGIVWAGIAPHPPLIVPEIGRGGEGQVAATVRAMEQLAASLKASGAETVVITSPHGPVFRDAVAVAQLPEVSGDFADFRAAQVKFNLNTDEELAAAIITACADENVPALGLGPAAYRRYRVASRLDHGVLVPWYYFQQAGLDLPLVWVGMSLLAPDKLQAFGQAVDQASRRLGRKVAFLASADLSHRLTPEAPAGYHPDGKRFDQLVVDKVRRGDFEGLLRIDPDLAERAGECGWRSIMMLSGAVAAYKIEPEVFSYEGSLGVGYLVADLKVQGVDKNATNPRGRESIYVQLARQSLETYVRTGRRLPLPASLPTELAQPAGAFVTLYKRERLRGCIGTILPSEKNLAAEIIANAISAGTRDPRFSPVVPEELAEISYSVDVLSPPEPIDSPSELDPDRYGVIVRSGDGRTGLLLPQLDGVDTVEQQVKIAKEKAGLRPGDKVTLERFEVQRYY